MLSYPRKSAQRYELITKFTINELTNFHKHPPKPHFRKFSIFLKNFAKKFFNLPNARLKKGFTKVFKLLIANLIFNSYLCALFLG